MSNVSARFQGRIGNFELDADFTVPAKGVTALFGPSGCGKTSVLRCMAGLQRLSRGTLRVGDDIWQDQRINLSPHQRPIGYVFQEASLFPHLSVRGNLEFGLKRSKPRNGAPKLDDIVGMLGLTPLMDRDPAHLSGGERQRVAIGRALMSAPKLLLMDEPLAALDRQSKNEILPYLQRLHDHLAVPVMYVSHDITEIERLADHMVLLEHGQVRATGRLTELLTNPELPFARAPEAAAVLDGQLVDYDAHYGLSHVAVNGGAMVVPGEIGELGSRHRLRVASADVGLCLERAPEGISILNTLQARIIDAESQTRHQMNVFLALGEDGLGAHLMARITRKSWEHLGLRQGSQVVALVKSASLVDKG